MPIRKKDTKPSPRKHKKPNVKRKPAVQPKVDEAAIVPAKSFHETFPITLEHKDGKDFKRCFFMCQEHCDSYIKRYKLKKGSYVTFKTAPKNEKEN